MAIRRRKRHSTRFSMPVWFRIWNKAMLHPSVNTYIEITSDETLLPKQVYTWIFWAFFLTFAFPALILVIRLPVYFPAEISGDMQMYGVLLAMAAVSSLAVLIVSIGAFLQDIMASMLGDSRSYHRLIVANAAILAPLLFPAFIVSLLMGLDLFASGFSEDYPQLTITLVFMGIIQILIQLYALALGTIAVKAIYNLSWSISFVPPFIWALAVIGFSFIIFRQLN